jgi:[acyl-carrier-protein] S-malonyltransferase
MRRLGQEGVVRVIEIGPGKVLSGLMKRIDSGVETVQIDDISSLKKIS